MQKIKILLADDHQLMLDGISSVLKTEKDLSIVATAANGEEVMEKIQLHPVDICLLDIQMPGMDGITTIEQLKTKYPLVKIIVVSTHNEKEIIFKVMRMGVGGYVLKNSSKTELVAAIKKVMNGGMYLSPEVEKIIIEGEALQTESKNTIVLTPREVDILSLLAKEYTNEQIANELFISYRTVETHRKNIMQKTGTKNLAGLIKFAISNDLLK